MTRALHRRAKPLGRLCANVAGLAAVATLSGCHNGQVDPEAVGYVVAVPIIAFVYAAPFIFGWGRAGGCH